MYARKIAGYESISDSEVMRVKPLSCTVKLEGVEGVVTVETDRGRIRDNLECLARSLGFGEDEVQRVLSFFDRRVIAEFGNAYTAFFPGANALDECTLRLIHEFLGLPPGVLASVRPVKGARGDESSPGWSLTLDVERIASYLPVFSTRSWEVEGYGMQQPGTRLQAFKQTLNSVLVHELVHVIQLAENEDAECETMRKEGKQIVRVVQAALVSGLPIAFTACRNPEAAAQYALCWFAVNAIVISVSTRRSSQDPNSMYSKEEEAYKIQRIVANEEGIMKNIKDPFTVTHEFPSPNSHQPPSFISSLRPFN